MSQQNERTVCDWPGNIDSIPIFDYNMLVHKGQGLQDIARKWNDSMWLAREFEFNPRLWLWYVDAQRSRFMGYRNEMERHYVIGQGILILSRSSITIWWCTKVKVYRISQQIGTTICDWPGNFSLIHVIDYYYTLMHKGQDSNQAPYLSCEGWDGLWSVVKLQLFSWEQVLL